MKIKSLFAYTLTATIRYLYLSLHLSKFWEEFVLEPTTDSSDTSTIPNYCVLNLYTHR